MAPVRKPVRGRGTWKVLTTALAFVVTVGLSSLGGMLSATVAAESQTPPEATEKTVPKKNKKKKKTVELPAEEPTVEEIIRTEWGDRADEALRVAQCESRLDPAALSRKGAVGVFQIMPRFHEWRVQKIGGSDLWDPLTNVRVALDLYEDQGWRPWVCARRIGLRA